MPSLLKYMSAADVFTLKVPQAWDYVVVVVVFFKFGDFFPFSNFSPARSRDDKRAVEMTMLLTVKDAMFFKLIDFWKSLELGDKKTVHWHRYEQWATTKLPTMHDDKIYLVALYIAHCKQLWATTVCTECYNDDFNDYLDYICIINF